MADMLNMPQPAQNTNPAAPAISPDISQFIGTEPAQKTLEVPQLFSDDYITQYFKSAIEAVQNAANKQIPAYNSPNTQQYIDSLKKLRILHDGNADLLDQYTKQFERATEAEKAGMQAEASAKIAENNANQQRSQQVADIAAALNEQNGVGGNADRLAQKTQVFHQLNDQALTLKASVEQDAAALREETAVNFTDDPIRWLEGVFKIPQLNDKLEAGEQQVKVLDNQIAGVQNDINETLAANAQALEARSKAIPNITAQQNAAANAMAAAIATEKSAKADQDLVKQSAAFTGIKFAEALSTNSAEHAASALQQEQAMNEFRAKMQEVVKANTDAEAKLKIVDLMEKMQDRRSIEAVLRLAETRMGLPPNTYNYTTYARSSPKEKEFLVGVAAGYAGTTPGDAYYNYRDAAERGQKLGPGISPQTAKMLTDMHEYVEGLGRATGGPYSQAINGKNKEERRDISKSFLNDKMREFANNPTRDPQKNPFYEVTPQIMATHFQGFAQTAEGKMLEPLIKSPTFPGTADVVSTLFAGNGFDVNKAARSISQYYQLNMQTRNAVTDFRSVGVNPPVQYNWIPPKIGPIFGNPAPIDLTNEAQVRYYLATAARQKKVIESIGTGGATP